MRDRRMTRPRAKRMLGVAAVELALTMVPMLILTFGVTEYGRAIYTYNTIDKAVRDAARYMTAPPPGSADPEADARNIVVYGNPQGSGARLAPGLSTGMVDICRACDGAHTAVPTGSGVVNLVTVRVSGYVYNSAVTYVAPATLNFSDISVTMRTNL